MCLPALFRDDKQSITCPFHRVSKNNIGEQTGVDWLLNRHRSAPSLPVGVIKLVPSFQGECGTQRASLYDNAHMRDLSSRWLCVACRFSRRSKTLRMQGCSTVCNVEQSGSGEVVGRCGGGPKEMYLHPVEVVRISSHTKSQWDNPRQSHGGGTDGN